MTETRCTHTMCSTLQKLPCRMILSRNPGPIANTCLKPETQNPAGHQWRHKTSQNPTLFRIFGRRRSAQRIARAKEKQLCTGAPVDDLQDYRRPGPPFCKICVELNVAASQVLETGGPRMASRSTTVSFGGFAAQRRLGICQHLNHETRCCLSNPRPEKKL